MRYKIFSILVFIILWEIIALKINFRYLPSPLEILQSLKYHIYEGELLHHLYYTLYRVLIAFVLALGIGVIFGLLMGRFKVLDLSLDPFLIFGLNIPALVVIILMFIWFGLNDFAAILAVVINKVPLVIVNIREGMRTADKKLLEVAKVYKISKLDVLKNFYLPTLAPFIMASARNGLALIWKIVLVVELLGLSEGMGFMLAQFFQFFDITSVLAYSLAFVIIILFIEYLILKPIDRKISFWR